MDYIRMKNYRQYRDVEIRFLPIEGKKTFIVIEGANGSGKTNLLNAIRWCLYGVESHIDEKYEGLPLVNMTAIDELSPGEDCEVEVKIQMKQETGEKILFRRLGRFWKLEDGTIEQIRASARTTKKTLFEMIRQENGDMVIQPNPHFTLQQIIPETISQYFFFDGERLNEYFRKIPGKTIKSEVHRISQLDLLEKATTHIDRRKSTFLKRFKDLSPEAEDIRKRLEVAKSTLEEYKQERRKRKLDREKYKEKEVEYRNKLKGSSIEDVVRLEEEREELEDRLERLENEEDLNTTEKFNFLINNSPVLLSHDAIRTTLEEIAGKIGAGEIPPDYKKDFLKKLLDEGKCICGEDLSEGSEPRRRLKALLRETDEIPDISVELIELNAELKSIMDEVQNFGDHQEKLNEQLRQLEVQRTDTSRRLKEIEQQISEVNMKRIREWESKILEYKEKKEDKISEIGEWNYRIESSEKEKESQEKNLERELKKEEKYSELEKIVSFCNKSLRVAKEIKDEIMEETRKEIEEKTSKQFFDLIWNPSDFKKVSIDENYGISVTHESGYETMGTLSAGQRQVLALSFMASLNKCSGFDVPIFIDTPLGRISEKPRDNIAINLPSYLEGKQVTLLMTDTEYTPRVRKRLTDRVGKEYRIEFTSVAEGKGRIAEVVPYE